jgi:hypothetical protein
VDISFTSSDLTLKVQDFAKRFLAQMMNNLAGTVATTIMQSSEGDDLQSRLQHERRQHRSRPRTLRRC